MERNSQQHDRSSRSPTSKKLSKLELAYKSERRKQDWISSVQNNDQFKEIYLNGAIIMKHPSQHDFRMPCDKSQIINRRYEPAKERAILSEKKYKEAILQKIFNEDEPNKKYYLRPNKPLLEVRPPMRYQPRDRLERIQQSVDRNPRVNLDQLNTKMLYHFEHRDVDRKGFLSKQGFSMKGFKQEKTPHWKEIINHNQNGTEPYINGLQALMNENAGRSLRRNQKLDMVNIPFNSVIPSDQLKNSLKNSTSLRCFQNLKCSLEALNKNLGGSKDNSFVLPKLESHRELIKNNLEFQNEQHHLMKTQSVGFFNSPTTNIKQETFSKQQDETQSQMNIYSEISKEKDSPKRFDKSKIKILKKQGQVVNIPESPKNPKATTQLLQLFEMWHKNPSIRMKKTEKSVFQASQNKLYQSQVSQLNDQDFTHKVYDQKLYFQSALNEIKREKSKKAINQIIKGAGETQNTFCISDSVFRSTNNKINNSTSKFMNVDYYNIKDLSTIKSVNRSNSRFKNNDVSQEEIEKQELHWQLQKSIIKQADREDIIKELKNDFNENHSLSQTSTKFNTSINWKSRSYKVLPMLVPENRKLPNGVSQLVIQVDKSQDISQPFNSSPFRGHSNSKSQLFKIKRASENQLSPNKRYGAGISPNHSKSPNRSQQQFDNFDYSERKGQVTQLLNHFFKPTKKIS